MGPCFLRPPVLDLGEIEAERVRHLEVSDKVGFWTDDDGIRISTRLRVKMYIPYFKSLVAHYF